MATLFRSFFAILVLVAFIFVSQHTEPLSSITAKHTVPSSAKAAVPSTKIETVESVARGVFHGSKESMESAEIKENGDTLTVRYNIQPWSVTVSWADRIFQLHVSDLVKNEFKRFPHLMKIKLIAHGTFSDIRGNESTADILTALFTRKNAESIHWNKIDLRNVHLLADQYWRHPQLEQYNATSR